MNECIGEEDFGVEVELKGGMMFFEFIVDWVIGVNWGVDGDNDC